MRLIDADELTEMVWRERLDTRERIANLIVRQPTIEAKPVKRGKWLPITEDIYEFSECSECGNMESCETPYCAQCGAIMDGDTE